MYTKNIIRSLGVTLLTGVAISFLLSVRPDHKSVSEMVTDTGILKEHVGVKGVPTLSALVHLEHTLLNKPGGFMSNDILPPMVLMDDMPSWELGVVHTIRDFTLELREGFSRSQSQSLENKWIAIAQPKTNIDTESWMFPSAEGEYADALDALIEYRNELIDPNITSSQFYTRADNLNNWLGRVSARLGNLSQLLSSSIPNESYNVDLAGDALAEQSTPTSTVSVNDVSWWKIDDNFHLARGTCYALIHLMRAAQVDFQEVLTKKNAHASYKQILLELYHTQNTLYSIMVMNGSGYGTFANHSLVMANYISRANAAIIELQSLLEKG